MRTVIFLGKRTKPGSPKADYPGATLWGTTHSNQKWAPKYGTVDDWDSWWDLHPFDPVPGYVGIKRRRARTYRWYQTLPGPDQPHYRPLWLTELDPTIPAGVVFPKEELLDTFPRESHGRWFTCQVDLMMAYVIMRRAFDHIVLHGHGTKWERAHMIDHVGVIYWAAIARERGIQVTILPPSWYLGPKHPYGISPGHWGLGATR